MRLRPMKPTTLAFLLILTAACAHKALPPVNDAPVAKVAAPVESGAQNTAKAFYTELRREEISGLPSTAQMKRLSRYLAPEIVAAIERARTEQTEFMRKSPDEKPPWIEGDLFSSLFEGVETWKLGTAKVSGTSAEVPVQLSYRGGSKQVSSWTDTLVLKKTQTGWQVFDIRMGGEWDFKAGGNTLRSTFSVES